MKLTITNSFGFCELNEQEMMMVDGVATVADAIVGTVSAVCITWAVPIACINPLAGLGVALVGAGCAYKFSKAIN